MSTIYGLGVDPAARADYFATALVHPADWPVTDDTTWMIDRVDRARGVELDEMHVVVAAILAQLDQSIPAGDTIGCALDATGIGAGPAAYLHKHLGDTGRAGGVLSRPIAYRGVHISPGDGERRVPKSPYLTTVSRQMLITDLVMIARLGRLHTGNLSEGERDMLAEELKGFRRRPTPAGKERMEHGSGADEHDDLLFALALALWIARRSAGSVGWVSTSLTKLRRDDVPVRPRSPLAVRQVQRQQTPAIPRLPSDRG